MGVFVAIAIIVIIFVILLRPGKFSMTQLNMLHGVNCAHRGLHSQDKSIPENSLSAFAAAAKEGYGIELDIQLSKDGQVVVFHDDTLERVCGVQGRVDGFTYDELCQYRLHNTQEQIPLLTQVFEVVNSTVPLIIELKTGPNNNALCEAAIKLMREYSGHYCIESFDPRIVRWFYKNAPDILRGQLSDRPKSFMSLQPWYVAFAVGNLLTNAICRPQFIAYNITKKPLLVKLAEGLGAMKVCYTARDGQNRSAVQMTNDCVIFEHYLPSKKFK